MKTLFKTMSLAILLLGVYFPLQSQEPIYAGLQYTTIGDAGIESVGDSLVVFPGPVLGNESGLRIFTTEAEYLLATIDKFDSRELPDGASIRVEAYGELNNNPDQLFGFVQMIAQGNEVLYACDFGPLGAQAATIIVESNGRTVARRINVTDNVLARIRDIVRCDPIDPIWVMDGVAMAIIDLVDPEVILLPDGEPVEGDKLIIIPEGINAEIGNLSEVRVLARQVPEFILVREGLGMFGRPHYALGGVQFNASAGQLAVSRIGDSGDGGLMVELDKAPRYFMNIEPLSLNEPGAGLQLAASGDIGGNPATFLGSVALENTGNGLTVNADYSPIGSESIQVEVYMDGVRVGSQALPRGLLGSIAGDVVLEGCGKVPNYPFPPIGPLPPIIPPFPQPLPCYILDFLNEVEFRLANQEVLVGNEIRLLAADADAPLEGLASFRLTGRNIEGINITNSTISNGLPAVLFGGLDHRPIGATDFALYEDSLGVFTSNTLAEVSGISIPVGKAGYLLTTIDEFDPSGMPNGALTRLNAFGQLNGRPDQPLGFIQMIAQGDLILYGCDFGALGAQSSTVIIERDGQEVSRRENFTGPTLAIVRGPVICDPLDPIWQRDGLIKAIIDFVDPQPIEIPGEGEVVGDRLIVMPEGVDVQVDFLSEVVVQTQGVGAFNIVSQGLGVNELPHYAIGEVRFKADGNRLAVSEMNSGEGLRVAFDRAPRYSADLEPIPLSALEGTSLAFSATGLVGGNENTFLGTATIANRNGEVQIDADYSPIGSESVRVEVLNNGNPTGALEMDGGGLIARLNGNVILDDCGKVPPIPWPPYPCFIFRFFNPIEFQIEGAPGLIGDEIRILAANADAPLDGLSSFSIIADNLDEMVILGETIEPVLASSSLTCPSVIPIDCPFEVNVSMDMADLSGANTLLGSFSGQLQWDPGQLAWVGPNTILSGYQGFAVVDAANGTLFFNGANAQGMGGVVDLFQTSFVATGAPPYNASISLSFSALNAAFTFEDLLPVDGSTCVFEVVAPGILGDVNGDQKVNSADALVVLSFDTGLPIPPPLLARIEQGLGDVNSDGSTNSTDALGILAYEAGVPVPFPVGQTLCPNAQPQSENLNQATVASRENQVGLIAAKIPVAQDEELFDVPVWIDMATSGHHLGSYSAEIRWNPDVLELISVSGGDTRGFEQPVINEAARADGLLKVAHAFVPGAAGEVNILNLRFRQLQAAGQEDFNIRFSSMAASGSFSDLLPVVPMQEGFDLLSAGGEGFEAYPNPASGQLNLSYLLKEEEKVQLDVYDAAGQKVQTLVDEIQPPGRHFMQWDLAGPNGDKLGAGVYLILFRKGEKLSQRKVVLHP